MKHYSTQVCIGVYLYLSISFIIFNLGRIIQRQFKTSLLCFFCLTGTLVATAQSLPKPEICIQRAVSNTFDAQEEKPYILRLNHIDTMYCFAGEAANYSWQDCLDGTAEFYASGLTSPGLEGEVIELYLLLSGGSKGAALKGKETHKWWYYSTLSGVLSSRLHGIYTIENSAEAFYRGPGVGQNSEYAAGGTINLFGENDYWHSGTIDMNLSEDRLEEDGLITNLYLNADTQQHTNILTEGAVFDLESMTDLTGISAQTTGTISHLRYTLSGPLNDELTVTLPEDMYKRGARLMLLAGKYTLTVQAFNRFEAQEKLCAEKTVSFQILGGKNEKCIDNQRTTDLKTGEDAPNLSGASIGESLQY